MLARVYYYASLAPVIRSLIWKWVPPWAYPASMKPENKTTPDGVAGGKFVSG